MATFIFSQIRFPYLDESVITFLSRLPVHVKVDPRLPKGHGDKLVLRQLALDSRVGPLTKTAVEMKRAIQFGARTAKMLDKTERGQDKLLIC